MSHPPGPPHLERTITLPGAVALVVGAVIGAGLYALIGSMGAKAGNAVWLAFVIAMIVSIIGAIPIIQVASAMPRAGAGYLFSSRLLFPMAGTVTSGVIVVAGACSTALTMVALTSQLPSTMTFGLSPHISAIAVLLVFYVIMLFGLKLAIGLQVLMVGQMIVALGIYCVAGLLHADLTFSLSPRDEAGAFFLVVVLCYNSCMGFQVLAEMGEEIQHAKRNIPLALLIGGAIVAALYIMVSMIFVNTLPYSPEAYRAENAPLTASAQMFLPGWAVAFLGLGAVTAGLTSLNAAAVALPRELFAQSRDRVLPAAFSRVAPHAHTPLVSVTAFFALAAALLLVRMDEEFYGLMAAVGIQVITAAIGVGSLRLPAKYPELYRNAYVTFPIGLLALCTTITLIVTVGFLFIVLTERWSVLVVYAALAAALALYHRVRVAHMRATGVEFDRLVRSIPGSGEGENGELPPSECQEQKCEVGP